MVEKSGLILLGLIGLVAPAFALGTGFTGTLSLVFVAVVMAAWGLFVVYERALSAGFAGAVPILVTFDMYIPGTKIGPIGLDLMIADFVILPVVIATLVLWQLDDGYEMVLLVGGFAVWATISGIGAVVAGYPAAGVLFGITQFRYVFVALAALGIIHRFNLHSVLFLWIAAVAYHSIVAIAQSLHGSGFGLFLYGEKGLTSAGQTVVPVGPLEFTTGLFTSGLTGGSRSLVLLSVFACAPALFFVYQCNYRSIPALGCVVLAPFVIFSSRSQNGLGALVISLVLAGVAIVIWQSDRDVSAGALMGGAGFCAIAGTALILWFLSLNLTSTSATRFQQYAVAADLGLDSPVGGIGIGNFDWYTNVFGVADTYAKAASELGIHNTFFAFFAGSGFIGLLLYLLAIAVPFWYCLRNFVARESSILIGLLAVGLISFHAFSSLTWNYHREVVMMSYWFISVSAGAYALAPLNDDVLRGLYR
jgi:O-antigen ligase